MLSAVISVLSTLKIGSYFIPRYDNLKSSVYFGHHEHVFWWMMLPGESGHRLSPNFATYSPGGLEQGTNPLSSTSSSIR